MYPDSRLLYKSDAGQARASKAYESLCQQITVPFTSRWVNTQVGLTHVLCAGDESAPPLVLLHGQGASAPTWNGQINTLAKDYQIFAVDVPASMGKSTPTRLSRSGTQAGDWLLECIRELGLSAVHLVGISNGAWLILKLATVAPQTIKSASLLSAAGLVKTSARLVMRAIPIIGFGALFSAERKATMFGRMMGVPGKPVPEQDMEMFRVLLGDFRMEPTPAPLSVAELRCLTAPTQLLIGEYEAAFPAPYVIERAKAVLPNLVHTEVLPGVGHGMITEDVPLVNARIHAFVQQYEGQR
jgi:pimeloyl-ACP methyl ester carboxylesterase